MKAMKPALLSSSNVRRLMQEGKREGSYAFIRTAQAVDELSRLHDALDSLHRTPNPSLTKEARAMKYRAQFTRAMEAGKASALAAVDALNAREAEIKKQAEVRAGLHSHIDAATLAEVRNALRQLPQAERDAAIRDAAQRGDAAVIQAVRNAPSALLTGHVGVPMESLLEMLVTRAAPDLIDELGDISTAFDLLNGATGAFAREAEARRDPHLEALADDQEARTRAADALIDAAVAGGPATLPTDLPAA